MSNEQLRQRLVHIFKDIPMRISAVYGVAGHPKTRHVSCHWPQLGFEFNFLEDDTDSVIRERFAEALKDLVTECQEFIIQLSEGGKNNE